MNSSIKRNPLSSDYLATKVGIKIIRKKSNVILAQSTQTIEESKNIAVI